MKFFYHKTPYYHQLKAFECLCYVDDVTGFADKLNQRGLGWVLLGYPFGKKGYMVMQLDTKKCYTSRDVIFVENSFLFH